MDKKQSFKKAETLKSKKDFEKIIAEGKSMNAYPLKLIYVKTAVEPGQGKLVKVAVSVPKKRVKFAVNRNRIKRLFREVYRINKQLLFNYAVENKIAFNLLFVFTGKETEADFNTFTTKIILLLQRLQSTNESFKRSADTSA